MNVAPNMGLSLRVWWGERLIEQRFVSTRVQPTLPPGLRAEVYPADRPAHVKADPLSRLREFAVPVALLSCLLAALVIGVVPLHDGARRSFEGDERGADEGEGGARRAVQLASAGRSSNVAPSPRAPIIEVPEAMQSAERVLERGQKKAAREQARALVEEVFSGLGPLAATDDAQLEAALRELKAGGGSASAGAPAGLLGGGRSGAGGGASSLSSGADGLGRLGTRGRGGGSDAYGTGVGLISGKKDIDVGITTGRPVVIGGLDKELIRRVMHRHRSEIRYCYELALTRSPQLAGRVAVKFVISASGAVAATEITEHLDDTLDRCIEGRVRTFTFPSPNYAGIVIVTYPWQFSPGE